MKTDPNYWLGSLTTTIDMALGHLRAERPEAAKDVLDRGLRRFVSSPVPSEELRNDLRSVKR